MVFDKYRYRGGQSFPVSAGVAGEELEKLGINERAVAPSEVVAAAKPNDAPLHPCFEWNNKKAADAYRDDQARRLIRSIEIVHVEQDDAGEDTREIAFVSVGTSGPKGQPGYLSTAVAMSDEDTRGRVISAALAQLRGWQSRYRHLQELAPIFAAIEEADIFAAAS